MVKMRQSKKCIPLLIIVLFIGGSIFPVTGIISREKNTKLTFENPIFADRTSIAHGWTQIIGDFPNGEMNNGFNNSFNVAVRGKTTFVLDDKEYLFLGTGNLLDSPFGMDMINTVFIRLNHIFFMWQNQFILNLLINIIENYFKRVSSQGCELWYYDGATWRSSVGEDSANAIIQRGFNNSNNSELTMLIPFTTLSNNITYLYAGTWNPREGCEIWRTDDPLNGIWQPIIVKNNSGELASGFGNPNNHAAYSAAVFNNWLYVGTMNWREGCEIWRTDGDIWEKVVGGGCSIDFGFGDDKDGFERDIYAWEMNVFSDTISGTEHLYVGTFNIAGCELWRTINGNNWTCLIGENGILKRGFNKVLLPLRTHNYGVRRMEIFNDILFIGTASVPPFGIKINNNNLKMTNILLESMGTGCEIWSYDGSDFTRVIGRKLTMKKTSHSGFGDWTNAYIWSLRVYDDHLLAGTWNPGRFLINISIKPTLPILNISFSTDTSQFTNSAGCEVWYTKEGDTWYQMVGDEVFSQSAWPKNGFGDNNNIGARAFIIFNDFLYLGITNTADGCEVWRFDGSDYPNN
jgi:hypothetical protein